MTTTALAKKLLNEGIDLAHSANKQRKDGHYAAADGQATVAIAMLLAGIAGSIAEDLEEEYPK